MQRGRMQSSVIPEHASIHQKGQVYWSWTQGCPGGQKAWACSRAYQKLGCRMLAGWKVNELQAEEIKQGHRWLCHKAPGAALLPGVVLSDKGMQICSRSQEIRVLQRTSLLSVGQLKCPHRPFCSRPPKSPVGTRTTQNPLFFTIGNKAEGFASPRKGIPL